MNAGSTTPDNTGTHAASAPGGGAADESTAVLDGALQGFRDMLAADGYELNWLVTGQDRVQIQIVAGADACADCLVPLPIIEGIMTDALVPTPYTLDRVLLPAGE
jgi:hypothetical protein